MHVNVSLTHAEASEHIYNRRILSTEAKSDKMSSPRQSEFALTLTLLGVIPYLWKVGTAHKNGMLGGWYKNPLIYCL